MPHVCALNDGKKTAGNCYNRMADTSDEETAELVALLLLCQSWDERAKAVTSSFI